MSLIALTLGAAAIIETAYYAFIMFGDVLSPKNLVGNAVVFATLVAAVIWQVTQPEHGAYATIVATAFATIKLIPTPFTVFLLAIASLSAITVHRPARGALCGTAYAILMILNGYLNPVGSMGGGSAYTFSGFIAAAVAIGYCIRITVQHDTEQRAYAETRKNMRIARELHDHTTNDLSDIILLINRNSSDDGYGEETVPQPTHAIEWEDLTTIRNIAFDALHHTREVIHTLEQAPNPPCPTSRCSTISDDPSSHHATEHGEDIPLEAQIQRHKQRLERLGYHGEVILLGEFDALQGAFRPVIRDFLRELFANIVKHADPSKEYTLMISVADWQCVIDMSDFPSVQLSPEPHDHGPDHIGMHSGLNRYRDIISRMGGTLTINDDSPWTLHASIPIVDIQSNPYPQIQR
ncbi:hypothetical protein JS528_06930 [Bifidobacterium sp. MA2]|uniref:Uncharacterized protein n=1 Tax=Bifidobacterium santillanense TaxID=2809028 RepID=A0ABS5UQ35_9BIFI|nr:hypothetical protein [Bifidobacterium santillanense]MBT1173088.1 hypothetical protein [Bifidobacterium santillanense]